MHDVSPFAPADTNPAKITSKITGQVTNQDKNVSFDQDEPSSCRRTIFHTDGRATSVTLPSPHPGQPTKPDTAPDGGPTIPAHYDSCATKSPRPRKHEDLSIVHDTPVCQPECLNEKHDPGDGNRDMSQKDLPRIQNILFAVAVILLTGFSAHMLTVANAQQNPFVGTWSTTQANGAISAYVDYFPNGTMHLAGPVSSPSGGTILHECGRYQVNPAQSTIQFVFTSYAPYLPGENGPGNINQPQVLGYQFANPNLLVFSDGSRYVRQPGGNPWPAPNGC